MKRQLYDPPWQFGPHGQTKPAAANSDFTCSHCRNFVTANPMVSGVHNRNHCPLCLYSRHMDLHQAGDRLAACRAVMSPLGLTVKVSAKKYGSNLGELMLIHCCSQCGAISINRIALDDDNDRLIQLYREALHLAQPIQARLAALGIYVLQPADAGLVERRLWGSRQSARLSAVFCG